MLSMLFFVMLLAAGSAAVAQSPQEIDAIVAEEEVTFGHAAYLALFSADPQQPEPTPEEAAREVCSLFRIGPGKGADDAATFGEFLFLLMEAHGVSGGVMYALLPGPRYAAREAVYRRWSSRSRAPGTSISGREALHILNRFLLWKESSGRT